MRVLSVSLVTVLIVAGMALVIGFLSLLIMLPSDTRPPMDTAAVAKAATQCAADAGQLEVTTDLLRRPIMVTCFIDD